MSESNLKLNDYVLASRFSDADIHDPWMIGPIKEIVENDRGEPYYTVNGRQFKYAIKLEPKTGEYVLSRADDLNDGYSYLSLSVVVEIINDYQQFLKAVNQ